MSLIALAQAASVANETPCCPCPTPSENLPVDFNGGNEKRSCSSNPTNVEQTSRPGAAVISNNSDSADWSRHMTVEERQFITKKIRTAYQRKAPTYEELLDACCAIEEEFVFMVAPSRLDYFKSGVQYEKRIVGKISGLRRSAATASTGEAVIVDETSRGIKRAKTQH